MFRGDGTNTRRSRGNTMSRMDAPINSSGESLAQRAARLTVARRRQQERGDGAANTSFGDNTSIDMSSVVVEPDMPTSANSFTVGNASLGSTPAGAQLPPRRGGTSLPSPPPPSPKPQRPKKSATCQEAVKSIEKNRMTFETLHVCDVLERQLDDPDGFDEALYVACEQYVNFTKLDEHVRRQEQTMKEQRKKEKNQTLFGMEFENAEQDRSDMHIQQRLMLFFEAPHSSLASKIFFISMSLLVVASCVAVILETLPQYDPQVNPEMKALWVTLDWVATGIFTVETGARFVVHLYEDSAITSKLQNAITFLRRPSNILDIVALLPTYFAFAFARSGRIVAGTLRTTRLLRLLKFLRKFRPIRRLVLALTRSAASLLAPFLFLALCLLLFSSTLFFAERGVFWESIGSFVLQDPQCIAEPYSFLPKFANMTINSTIAGSVITGRCPYVEPKYIAVGQTLWWGIVTFSTVGFGDFVPITVVGKVVAGFGMICGLIFIAMPIAVLGTNYTIVMEQRVAEKERKYEELARRSAMLAEAENEVVVPPELQEELDEDVNPHMFVLPGEQLLSTLKTLTGLQTLSLTDPSDETLYVLDSLLEATIKQLTGIHAEADENMIEGLPKLLKADPSSERKGPFKVKMQEQSGLPTSQLPLWTATTKSVVPSDIRGTVQHQAANRSDVGRPLHALAALAASSDEAARLAFSEVTETVTLSRPISLRLGSSYSQQHPSCRPEVVIYNEQIASSMIDAHHHHESDSDIEMLDDILLDDLSSVPSYVPISNMHAKLSITQMWGERRILLRTIPGCGVAVLRKSVDTQLRDSGLVPAGAVNDPFFATETVEMNPVSVMALAGSRTSRRRSIVRLKSEFEIVKIRQPKRIGRGHGKNSTVGFSEMQQRDSNLDGNSNGGAPGSSGGSAPEGTGSKRDRMATYVSPIDAMERVIEAEGSLAALVDGDFIAFGSFIPDCVGTLLTCILEGRPIPSEIGGEAAAERVLFYQYRDNTGNYHV